MNIQSPRYNNQIIIQKLIKQCPKSQLNNFWDLFNCLIVTFTLSWLLVICQPVLAITLDPTRLGEGARSLALGRAAVAMSGDLGSMFINPALAANLKSWGATTMYTSLLEGDITYTLLGGEYKTAWGTLGISYLGGASFGLQVSTRDADGRIIFNGNTFDYANQVLSFLFGREIKEDLAAGAALKLFRKEFTGPSGSTGSGFDLDLGLLWKPRKDLSVGISQQNTLPSSIASLTWGTNEKEGIPFNTKLGLAYAPRDNLLLAADLDCPSGAFHGGVEWKLRQNFDLRAGFDGGNFTTGVGLKFKDFIFDLAYYIDRELSANSTYYFSISYLAPERAPTPPPSQEAKKPTPSRRTFSDVPPNYWAKDAIELLAGAGVISGFPDGTFRPEKGLTRAEMCSLLVKTRRTKDERTTDESSIVHPLSPIVFKDVSEKHWAVSYIAQAAEEGLVKGYPNGSFRPGLMLKRAEGVLILARFAQLKPTLGVSPYSDIPATHWAAPEIAAAKGAGLLDYIKGNSFEPSKDFSRAEAAYIIYKIGKGGW